MAFRGNTRNLGSFGEEKDEFTDLHQILEDMLLTERGDVVAGIKRHRSDPSSDGFRDLVTASGRSRKPAFVCIAVDTSRETRVRRKDTIRKLDQFAQFFFSSFTEGEGWDRIEEYVQYQDDIWDDMSSTMNVSSITKAKQPTFRGSYETDECKQTNLAKQVCLSGGDIYDDPSLLRFYQNDDTLPWGNNKHKEKGEDDPEWIIRTMITHAKGPTVFKEFPVQHKEKLEKCMPLIFKLREECSAYYPKESAPKRRGSRKLHTAISENGRRRASPDHFEAALPRHGRRHQLPVVISFVLSTIEKARLLEVLRNHKGAIAWSIVDIEGIDSSFCTHKILMEDEFKLSVQPQRRVNPNIKEVVPKKGGMTIVKNEKDELIPQRTVTGWRMLERLAGHEYYCFLDGFLGYFTTTTVWYSA
ncbi:hypothetical protein Tco_0365205 [Tanacetum coccineum]